MMGYSLLRRPCLSPSVPHRIMPSEKRVTTAIISHQWVTIETPSSERMRRSTCRSMDNLTNLTDHWPH